MRELLGVAGRSSAAAEEEAIRERLRAEHGLSLGDGLALLAALDAARLELARARARERAEVERCEQVSAALHAKEVELARLRAELEPPF